MTDTDMKYLEENYQLTSEKKIDDATSCLDDTGTYVNFKLEFAPRKTIKKISK